MSGETNVLTSEQYHTLYLFKI